MSKDLMLAHNKDGWVISQNGLPIWLWPTPGDPEADVPAWVVREILEAFDEQQMIMDGMYDAPGPAADDVMDIIIENLGLGED